MHKNQHSLKKMKIEEQCTTMDSYLLFSHYFIPGATFQLKQYLTCHSKKSQKKNYIK